MTAAELREDVRDELAQMKEVVAEPVSLRRDVGAGTPTLREKVAGGAFLTQFYNGIENVLKRISKYQDVPLPSGEKWHAELFDRFTTSGEEALPALFDETLAEEMRTYRAFRHVARSSYGTELDWERMKHGLDPVEPVFQQIRHSTLGYLDTLDPT